MTGTVPPTTSLPIERSHPLDPPEELGLLREQAPVSRLTYADGHVGWLVTGYAAVKAVLADSRFSARGELRHPPLPVPALTSGSPEIQAQLQSMLSPPGMFIRMDPPDHTRYRRLLTGQFTVRRMKQLEPRIEQIVRDRLDDMVRQGPPVDLVPEFALPIPSLVICELLGVPYADRDRFQRDSAALLNLETSAEQTMTALKSMNQYLYELVGAKRAEQVDDILSGLIGTGELTDEELVNMAFLLLIAGHETTANMLGLGTYALLRRPDQLAALRADPALVNGAVEELLRYLTIIHIGAQRVAVEDVELDGQLIKAGEAVMISVAAANRDPERFERPDELDVTRSASGHVSFGHGVHQCLGQQLARVEMRIAFAALFGRFPELRLAVPPEEVPMRTTMSIYGVHQLPVEW